MSFNIIKFDEIDSTNDYLKRTYLNYGEKTVIVANYQTSGRGRMNRIWIDSKNNNLSFSILLYPKTNEPHSTIALMACASVFEVLSEILPNVVIKWPNDILINHKKVCGILVESIYEGNSIRCIIIGIGINVNTSFFPTELKDKATSLWLETKQRFDKDKLLDEILKSVEFFYHMFLNNDHSYINICRKNFFLIGKQVDVVIDQKTKKVRVLNILDNGNLLISDQGVKKEIFSGEIILSYNSLANSC